MAEPATPSPVIAPVSTGYRRYALWVLLIIYTLNFLDRQVVNILAEPIKRDLGLADWQLGMMTGLAFAIFYTVLGIPIARIAETKNRPYIIGASVAAWSAFTVLCGFTQNFWQLILMRIGVGVGEAGCTPPAHSLITDYVPRANRASAIAFFARPSAASFSSSSELIPSRSHHRARTSTALPVAFTNDFTAGSSSGVQNNLRSRASCLPFTGGSSPNQGSCSEVRATSPPSRSSCTDNTALEGSFTTSRSARTSAGASSTAGHRPDTKGPS